MNTMSDPARLSLKVSLRDRTDCSTTTLEEGRAMNRRVFATITRSRTVTVQQQAQ